MPQGGHLYMPSRSAATPLRCPPLLSFPFSSLSGICLLFFFILVYFLFFASFETTTFLLVLLVILLSLPASF